MTSPAIREFEIMERGAVRDLILNYFRYGLRTRDNPETGELFTDDEIARATAPGTRWYIEAQGIDDYAQGEQRRALWLNDQLRINRACTQWLEEFHAPQWDPEGRLDATSGSGAVLVTGTNGTGIVASTTIPDETAYWGTTPAGIRVQVYEASEVIGLTGGATTSGQTLVTMVAMDPGSGTNLEVNDVITWANRDPGMAPTATVSAAWSGGTDVETDAEWASRMEGNQKHRAGSGNDAQQRAWARAASNAVEDAFIYPCAFGLNSFEVCVVQKRSGVVGPLARVPSEAVLASVTAQMVPPGSPVQPTPPQVVVVAPYQIFANIGARLSLLAGAAAGWADSRPFPNRTSTVSTALPYVLNVTSTTVTVYSADDSTLPGLPALSTISAGFPRMMAWEESTSSWHEIAGITQIEQNATHSFILTMPSVPSWLALDVIISPFTELHEVIAEAVVAYLDERGPDELFADTDSRYGRCSRFPALREEKPYAVGTEVANRIVEALPGAASSGDCPVLFGLPGATPTILSPQMYFLGKVGVYPLV